MESPFRFKQFEIFQDRCAMKVGTDGVLLGAWAPVNTEPASLLDIGTGTGLIALMLAQRTMADTIDAVEIDGDAFEQCVENFEASPWSDRLFCYHAGLDEMVEESDATYDLIVSNPPFYSETVTSGSESRDRARQNLALPFSELIRGVEMLLAEDGIFATIIPFQAEASFRQMAREAGLHLFKATRVKGTPKSAIKRSLLAFSRKEQEIQVDELTIEKERHEYTEEYTALCRDFYLKM